MHSVKRQGYLKQPLLNITEQFFLNLEIEYPIYLSTNHPHILNEICDLWKTPSKMRNYLNGLVFSDANQQGFSSHVFKEILEIQTKYDSIYPEDNDIWIDPKVRK